MSMDAGFFPDAARAAEMDRRMRAGLADSLEYLAETLAAQLGANRSGLDALVCRMRAGAVYPASTFGLYYEAASALIDGDHDAALTLFDELAREQPRPSDALRIVTLEESGTAANAERYRRLMDNDAQTRFGFIQPAPEVARKAHALALSSLARLERAVPALAHEFRALVRDLIFVAGLPGADYQFAGGSSYMLWGALFLNAEHHADEIAMIEAMAHESAHSLLFGFSYDEALVRNADDELFPSPLRVDPRPMDGIYHATYVSARMHWALSQLLESGDLIPAETEFAREARDADLRSFFDGHEVVRAHGELTATGQALMDQALAYMQSVRATA